MTASFRNLLFAVLACACCVAQLGAVRAQKLDAKYNDADISPDGKLVAVTVSHVGDSELLWRDEVQLWDWRTGKQVAIQVTTSAITKKANYSHLRFTGDGKLLVVTSTSEPAIKVLTVPDLKPARAISLEKVNGNRNTVLAFEISPNDQRIAVLFASGPTLEEWNHPPKDLVDLARDWKGPPSRLVVFDLNTGAQTASADLDTWISAYGTISWSEDGKKIATIATRGGACNTKQGSRVQIFDAVSGATLIRFDARFAETLAFASGNQLLAAEYGCEGVFQQKMPSITIYDAATGKPVRKLSGGEWEARHQVHVSADRRRAIGFVEQQSTSLPDLGGAVRYTVNETRHFFVWDIASGKVIAQSPAFRWDNAFGVMEKFRLNRDGSVALAFYNMAPGDRSNSVIAVAEIH